MVLHPGWLDVPVVKSVATLKRRPVLFDYFIGFFDTVVADRGLISPRSPLALILRAIDWVALRMADGVMVDTPARQRRLKGRSNTYVQWVGASSALLDPAPVQRERSGDVLFYGTYSPLQGAEIIVRAAAILRYNGTKFRMIGDGQEFCNVRALATELGASNVAFERPMPLEQLVEAVRDAEIVLGIFGTSSKALTVVPHKVFDAVAAGRPVLSAETEGLRDAFSPQEVVGVPPGDPEALARAIEAMLNSSSLLATAASNGRRRYEQDYTDDKLASALDRTIRSLIRRRLPIAPG